MSLSAIDQVALRDWALQMHRRNLGEGVDSGVGPPRALRQDLFAGKPFEAIGQRSLHRRQSGLHLPAVKLGTVVRQSDFQIAGHATP